MTRSMIEPREGIDASPTAETTTMAADTPVEPVHIGILGAGGYGRTARQHLHNSGQYTIVACLDHEPAVTQHAAQQENAQPYDALDDFLNHPGMQAVSINTPANLHAQHIKRCLESGKHVLVTKPVTNQIDDAQALRELAQSRQLSFMVGHHAAHTPVVDELRAQLASGRIGQLCNVLVTCCSSAGLAQEPGAWRTLSGQNPGGPLLQCGIHLVHLLLDLLGPVDLVKSIGQRHITDNDTLDNLLVLMQFADGVQASMVCNYTTAYLHTISFMGTHGNLHVHEHVTDIGQTELYFQPRRHGTHEPWEPIVIPDGVDLKKHDYTIECGFAQQIRHGKPDYANLDLAIAALHIVHLADRDVCSQPVHELKKP